MNGYAQCGISIQYNTTKSEIAAWFKQKKKKKDDSQKHFTKKTDTKWYVIRKSIYMKF